jgi:hypothetical protein
MECRWEKSVTPPRRAKYPVFRNRSFESNAGSAQTLINQIWLNQMLELAKGFEPPTL